MLGLHAEAFYAQSMVDGLRAVESLVDEASSLDFKSGLFASLCGSAKFGKVEAEGPRLAGILSRGIGVKWRGGFRLILVGRIVDVPLESESR